MLVSKSRLRSQRHSKNFRFQGRLSRGRQNFFLTPPPLSHRDKNVKSTTAQLTKTLPRSKRNQTVCLIPWKWNRTVFVSLSLSLFLPARTHTHGRRRRRRSVAPSTCIGRAGQAGGRAAAASLRGTCFSSAQLSSARQSFNMLARREEKRNACGMEFGQAGPGQDKLGQTTPEWREIPFQKRRRRRRRRSRQAGRKTGLVTGPETQFYRLPFSSLGCMCTHTC